MILKDKIAVVTGVSKGIGLATVTTLLENGAIVAGWGRTNPELKHANFHFFETDVRNQQSVEQAYQQTTEKLGSDIRILINNAGLGIAGKLEEIRPEHWHLMFDTNVHGIFYCTRLLLPNMKTQEEGHIINISSIAGLTGIEEMSGYCATKYAV
ncbi:MAG: SDR family oxidoreductase, partial [Hymenobacteraceae bacterium]|nr:SDR family oxidoreductase [Hymenobacteraceae bacterium]MDX5396656.1 SDR family oxidoreductase [Hymenobacteraceae bacterium]MDX5512722.1 SDR family oxidoreductase [Hymenobacteraceae bacterium]